MQRKKQIPLQERLSDVFVALLLPLVLFYTDNAGYIGITNAKWSVFVFLCAGYVVASLLLWIEERLVGETEEANEFSKNALWRIVAAFAVSYFLCTLLSSLFSIYPDTVWIGGQRREGAITIFLYVLCFLLIAKNGTPKKWMLDLLAICVFVESIICILQLCGDNPLKLYPNDFTYYDSGVKYRGEFLGTIGNVDFLGTFFVMAIPLLGAGAIKFDFKRRILYIIPIAFSVFVVVEIKVLSCILGIVVALLVFAPILLPVSKKAKRALAIAIVICILTAAGSIFFLDIGNGVLHQLHGILRGNIAKNVDSGRIYIWKEVWKRVPERLAFGHGPDTMYFSDIKPFERYDENLGILLTARIDAAHNEFLNVLYHQGLFALISFTGIITAVLIAGFKGRKDCSTAILTTSVSSYTVQACFNISMFFVAIFFWILMGLLISEYKKKGQGL